MTLDDLIDALRALNPSARVSYGFGAPMSYRGDYASVAFAPLADALVSDMLSHAESAKGRTFDGYKGGEYLMSGDEDCYIAEYGESGAPQINEALMHYWQMEAQREA